MKQEVWIVYTKISSNELIHAYLKFEVMVILGN